MLVYGSALPGAARDDDKRERAGMHALARSLTAPAGGPVRGLAARCAVRGTMSPMGIT